MIYEDLIKSIMLNPSIFILLLINLAAILAVIYVYIKNKKEITWVEKVLLIIFILGLSNITIPPLSGFSPTDMVSLADGRIVPFLSSLIFNGILLFALSRRKGNLVQNIKTLYADKFLAAFFFFSIISIIWSGNPFATLLSNIAMGLTIFVAFYIASNYSNEKFYKVLEIAFAIILILSAIVAIMFPSFSFNAERLEAIAVHPNQFGILMAFSSLFWFMMLISRGFKEKGHKLKCVIFILLSISLLMLSKSIGALFSFIGSSIVLLAFLILKKMNDRSLAAGTSFFIFIGIVGLTIGGIFATDILHTFGKDTTLTGRIPFWNYLWHDTIQENLWLGTGYGAFFRPFDEGSPSVIASYEIGSFAKWHAHNGFVQIAIDFGIIGLILFAAFLLRTLFLGIKNFFLDKSYNSIFLALTIIFVILINISEVSFFLPDIMWLFFMTALFRLNKIGEKDAR